VAHFRLLETDEIDSVTNSVNVTARTKCYSIEGSFVDYTIEDTKLKREEEGRKGEE